jgi:CCR4-NOT transcription complex subunit 9
MVALTRPVVRYVSRAAHIPLFLYPFLNTVSKTRPFEYLRLTSLGVIGALVKVRPPHGRCHALCSWSPLTSPAAAPARQVDDTDVINFLLSTEIIPLCLRTMEMGSELSKTVATFIVQKILLDDVRAPRRPATPRHGRSPWALSLTPSQSPLHHVGLAYICATAERCYAVGAVLGSMVQMLVRHPHSRSLMSHHPV